MRTNIAAAIAQHLARRKPSYGGRKTLYTYWRAVGRSKYMPHQGKRECARRKARL